MTLHRFRVAVALALVVLPGLVSCRTGEEGQGTSDGRSTDGGDASAPAVPFELTVGQTGVLYTWIDAEGRFHVTEKVEEIPEDRRSRVRVAVDGKPTGTATHVFVADLSKTASGGKAPVSALGRTEWEALGLGYRASKVTPLEEAERKKTEQATAQAESAGAPPAGVDAVVYGADWCGPCHQAEDYLKKKGLAVVKKDIEEDPGAAKEMRSKLQKAGLGGSSIPVLDVGGSVLVGFSPRAIDAAIRRMKSPG